MSKKMKTKSITVSHISKGFENQMVLNDISYEFTQDRITCIMGSSGIGKTTLLNILLGLIKPDSGEIVKPPRFLFSAVFQEDRLCEDIDAIANVLLVLDKGITIDKIKNEFSLVGLEDYQGKPVKELSGGMKRRVAIVRAMMAESDAVILDEPFGGLNNELKLQVIDYVKERLQGKIGIVVTHDIHEVKALGGDALTLTK